MLRRRRGKIVRQEETEKQRDKEQDKETKSERERDQTEKKADRETEEERAREIEREEERDGERETERERKKKDGEIDDMLPLSLFMFCSFIRSFPSRLHICSSDATFPFFLLLPLPRPLSITLPVTLHISIRVFLIMRLSIPLFAPMRSLCPPLFLFTCICYVTSCRIRIRCTTSISSQTQWNLVSLN